MLRNIEEEKLLIKFLFDCTKDSDVRYYKCKQISRELDKKVSSKKIAFFISNWSNLKNDDFKISLYAQRSDAATWRIERCR